MPARLLSALAFVFVLAIVKGDELKLCLRHGRSSGGRPTEFSTKPDSGLISIVFKRTKVEQAE